MRLPGTGGLNTIDRLLLLGGVGERLDIGSGRLTGDLRRGGDLRGGDRRGGDRRDRLLVDGGGESEGVLLLLLGDLDLRLGLFSKLTTIGSRSGVGVILWSMQSR